ncbi:MAG TPA: helix-turn-helix domain-containing protein [Streptosporangiaceae bacterium]|nr:helix-turn-helix domain-containing protein [Streptosporangiaceae bacterium]
MSGSQPAAAAEVWSTSVVDPSQAFEYWHDLICDTFVQSTAAPTRPGHFTGQITYAEVGGLEISTVRAGGQRVRRTPQLIARAGEQYLLASIQTRGRGRVEQDGRVAVLDPGAMALHDSTRPYTLHFDDAFEQVIVKVPLVDILAESGLRDAGQVTAVDLGDGGPAGVIARFFQGLSRTYATDPEGSAALAAHGRGLMASALTLSAGRPLQERPASSLTQERVRAFLRSRHSDPGLCVDDIARCCLVSRRSLYRLFETDPDGVGGLLRRVRIEHAQALLRADPFRSVESIASACGFAGERQFYRLFRQETGCTPGEFRAAGTSGQ